jgi:hypothetical protein
MIIISRNVLQKACELNLSTVALCVINSVRRNFPPDEGAHIALSMYFISFLPQFPICIPLLPRSRYMPRPSHPLRLHYSDYTRRRLQIVKLLIMQFLHSTILAFYYLTSIQRILKNVFTKHLIT